MKRICFSLYLVVAFSVAVLAASGKPKQQPVSMFGVGMSFVDSVVYITEVHPVEAFVMPNGFLADRSLYALQLSNHLSDKMGLNNTTCAVFFSTKPAKAEKKHAKLLKKYNRGFQGMALRLLRQDDFRFVPQEWVETIVETQTPNVKDKKEKNGKK